MSSRARFPGFPDRMTYLPVPASFFGTLLRDIDDLAELKLMLHCWRLLHQRKGSPRYLRRSELESDRTLLLALRGSSEDDPVAMLARALAAASDRGTLLRVDVEAEDTADACYFLNTPANQRIIERVRAGDAQLGPFRTAPASGPPPLPQPGIFELYEQNIGLLTPLLADELREAELRYPADWIEEAFREAVAYNRRNWRYVLRILENWATRGRGERGENRRYPQPPDDPARYLQGRYGRLLKR